MLIPSGRQKTIAGGFSREEHNCFSAQQMLSKSYGKSLRSYEAQEKAMSEMNQSITKNGGVATESNGCATKPMLCLETTPLSIDILKTQAKSVPEASETPAPKMITEASPSTKEHEPCDVAGKSDSLGDQLAEVLMRLSRLETRTSKLEKNSGNGHHLLPKESQAEIEQVRTTSNQLEIIVEGLLSTPDYNIGRIFYCQSCSLQRNDSYKSEMHRVQT